MKLSTVALPKEQIVDAYRSWIDVDVNTWLNDRSTMALNHKAATMRRKRLPDTRDLSMQAVIYLLMEEHAKGSLTVDSTPGADPYHLYVYLGYLETAHRLADLCVLDAMLLLGLFGRISKDLAQHDQWAHYIIQPSTLREAMDRVRKQFNLQSRS